MGITIDVTQIPRSEGCIMGYQLYDVITEFFEDEENQKKFEQWKEERMHMVGQQTDKQGGKM